MDPRAIALVSEVIAALQPQPYPTPWDWRKVASADPTIREWQRRTGQTTRTMEGDLSYDYPAAIMAGQRPHPEADYHWSSSNPATGQFLKSFWHPTMLYEIEARKKNMGGW